MSIRRVCNKLLRNVYCYCKQPCLYCTCTLSVDCVGTWKANFAWSIFFRASERKHELQCSYPISCFPTKSLRRKRMKRPRHVTPLTTESILKSLCCTSEQLCAYATQNSINCGAEMEISCRNVKCFLLKGHSSCVLVKKNSDFPTLCFRKN